MANRFSDCHGAQVSSERLPIDAARLARRQSGPAHNSASKMPDRSKGWTRAAAGYRHTARPGRRRHGSTRAAARDNKETGQFGCDRSVVSAICAQFSNSSIPASSPRASECRRHDRRPAIVPSLWSALATRVGGHQIRCEHDDPNEVNSDCNTGLVAQKPLSVRKNERNEHHLACAGDR